MARKPPKKIPRFVYRLAALLFRFYYSLMRVRVEDPHGILDYARAHPDWAVVAITWHNRLCFFAQIIAKDQSSRATAVISASNDGEYLSCLLREFHVGCIRGSSSRKSLHVLHDICTGEHAGRHIIFTPDGPRGPRYEMAKGPVYVASKLQRPVIPLMINASRYWQINSWDGFQIPKPFAKVTLTYGERIAIPPDLTDEQIEQYRVQLRDTLNAMKIDRPNSSPSKR